MNARDMFESNSKFDTLYSRLEFVVSVGLLWNWQSQSTFKLEEEETFSVTVLTSCDLEARRRSCWVDFMIAEVNIFGIGTAVEEERIVLCGVTWGLLYLLDQGIKFKEGFGYKAFLEFYLGEDIYDWWWRDLEEYHPELSDPNSYDRWLKLHINKGKNAWREVGGVEFIHKLIASAVDSGEGYRLVRVPDTRPISNE